MFKKVLAIILTLCFAGMTAGGCGNNESGKTDETTAQAETKAAEIKTNLPKLDMKKWQYDEDDKIYYQLGLDYCEKPADKTLEETMTYFKKVKGVLTVEYDRVTRLTDPVRPKLEVK